LNGVGSDYFMSKPTSTQYTESEWTDILNKNKGKNITLNVVKLLINGEARYIVYDTQHIDPSYFKVGIGGATNKDGLSGMLTQTPNGFSTLSDLKKMLVTPKSFYSNSTKTYNIECTPTPSYPLPPDTVGFTIEKFGETGIISVKYVNNSKHITKYVGINGLKLDKKGAQ